MFTMLRACTAAVLLFGTSALLASCGEPPVARAATERVELVRVPDGGIQPQAVADERGTAHVVYLKGDPGACDVFYTRRTGASWSVPLRVNRRPGSAVAMGTIRGPQLALGKNGSVHVVWFGSRQSGLQGPEGSAPLLYARLSEGGGAFEPERNLMQASTALDGGPGVAADVMGNVYVAWQAAARKGEGEENRRLWIARSTDDGKSFSQETPAGTEPTGACPCCSTEVFADRKGHLYTLYRMAANRTERDMVLVTSANQGRTFQTTRIDPWPVDS